MSMSKKLDFNDISDEQIMTDTKGGPGGNSGLLTLAEGDTLLRIMPPWAKDRKYYKAYKMHFSLNELVNYGLEVDGWFNSPCLADSAIGKCPLCALANRAKALGTRNNDLGLLALSKAIRAKQQYIANVVNMNKPEEGVKLLPFGQKVYEGLQNVFARKGNITHPITGRNIVITKREIPGQRWFDYSVSPDDVDDISENWDFFKGQLQDLDAYPKLPDYDSVASKVASIELVAPNSGSVVSAASSAPIPGYVPSKPSRNLEEVDRLLDEMED